MLTTCALDAAPGRRVPPAKSTSTACGATVRLRRRRDPGFEASPARCCRARKRPLATRANGGYPARPRVPDVVEPPPQRRRPRRVLPLPTTDGARGAAVGDRASCTRPPTTSRPAAAIFRECSRRRGLRLPTYGERRLAEMLFPIGHRPQIVMASAWRKARRHVQRDRPSSCASARSTTARLGAAGPVLRRVQGPPARPLRWSSPARSSAAAAIPTSRYSGRSTTTSSGAAAERNDLGFAVVLRSLSIVLMEAWTARTPVLVNGHCLANREHCERSGGGLWFGATPGSRPRSTASQRRGGSAGAGRGRGRYVEENFRWPVIIDRYRFPPTSLS